MKPQHEDYEGHRLEIVDRHGKLELLIDNVPVPYGRFPNGKFFLHDYAYDWQDDLLELARRYVSYQRRVASIRAGTTQREK